MRTTHQAPQARGKAGLDLGLTGLSVVDVGSPHHCWRLRFFGAGLDISLWCYGLASLHMVVIQDGPGIERLQRSIVVAAVCPSNGRKQIPGGVRDCFVDSLIDSAA